MNMTRFLPAFVCMLVSAVAGILGIVAGVDILVTTVSVFDDPKQSFFVALGTWVTFAVVGFTLFFKIANSM